MPNILVEKLLFGEMSFVWTASNLIDKHSFLRKRLFQKDFALEKVILHLKKQYGEDDLFFASHT